MNLCLSSDSYKAGHNRQYPRGTTLVSSYLESRGGRFPETVFHGLQYPLIRYLSGEAVTAANVQEAKDIYDAHFGQSYFNAEGWRHIVDHHSGRLPISIRAAREGTVIPYHNVLMTIENTCPHCYWLTNFLETLLMQAWYPISVATQSRAIRNVILKYLVKSGDPAGINFKLHDFGCRGVSSMESAAVGGTAHLAAGFMGTDTVPALMHARTYYAEPMAGFSIPASEHSTITSWGREHEVDAYQNMLDQYPTGLMACVSDSYDILAACTDLWGGTLKDRVLARDGVLVVRPDSGDPVSTILAVLKALGSAFGTTYNTKGYKVLNPKVRVIQGDGVNFDSIEEILRQMDKLDWSTDNIAFGMGGALLQKLDRDTQKMALKCCYVEGHTGLRTDTPNWGTPWSRDVYKEPAGEPMKVSKRGRQSLVLRNGIFYTQPSLLTETGDDQLVEVFRDGKMLSISSLADIRSRATA